MKVIFDDPKYCRKIFETLQSGINIIDPDGKIIYANKSYCQMHGYAEDELVGKSFLMILAENERKNGLSNFKKILNNKIKKPFVVRSINCRKDGSLFPIVLAWNYLIQDDELIGMITAAQDISEITKTQAELEKSKDEIKQLTQQLRHREYLEYMMGESQKIKEVHNAIEKVAVSDYSVIIMGETGTGKEIVAQAIHNFSRRSEQPIISIDCGAITESLIESELFGYVKGAFTGAYETRNGAFQKADKGSIFLDEIGNLSLEMQKKLLRVLQEREVQKIGSTQKEKLDVRIIAAADDKFLNRIKSGKFRKDLFYRLNEFSIKLPALKERKADIPQLTYRFIRELCSHLKMKTKKISSEALSKLIDHTWPGNVRELKNAVKRAIIVCAEEILPAHLDLSGFDPELSQNYNLNLPDLELENGLDFKKTVKDQTRIIEQKIIQQVLKKFEGNKSQAAKFLNIDYKTMLKKAKITS